MLWTEKDVRSPFQEAHLETNEAHHLPAARTGDKLAGHPKEILNAKLLYSTFRAGRRFDGAQHHRQQPFQHEYDRLQSADHQLQRSVLPGDGSTGSGDQIQVGTGVQVASNSTDFTGGSISSTGIDTDAAINGTGFFVVDNNGSQLYTRDGNFQTSASGTLESSGGQAIMGYAAVNGVINTAGGLSDMVIPVGQVMQPMATSSFSATQNLDSSSPIGTQTEGQVQIYDSLGTKYDATVTYTNLGNNQWSYSVTVPDTLAAAPATAAAATTLPVAPPTPVPTSVAAATTAAEPSTTVSNPLMATTSATTSSSATLPPSAVTPASVSNPLVTLNSISGGGTTTDTYTFAPTGTVNQANTSLTITGPTAGGGPPTTTSIVVTPTHADGTVAQLMNDITTALGASNITNAAISVTSPSPDTLIISGPTTTLE